MLKKLKYQTSGDGCEVIDVTGDIQDLVSQSSVQEGLVAVCVPGSTASISTTEFEPNTVVDIKNLFEKVIPDAQDYQHNKTWGDGNGFSHLRATLLGPSQSFAIAKGQVLTGSWQQIVLIDFDNKAKTREVIVKIIKG
ncbi:MAG: secondary thiamine-phosphate synthase enzyme YjbQ [Patescibacteria group bacterium]